MKKLGFLFLLLMLGAVASGQIFLTTSDEITMSGHTLDSSGFYVTADSMRIVTYLDGAEMFDAWFNTADAQCSGINGMLVFTDAFGDIDGAGGNGLYELKAGWFEDDGDLYNWKTLWVYIGGQVGVDLADNAVDAGAIADDAIDYATFAGTTPTAWWNEGKTGYALSAASIDAFWDEDTTGHNTANSYGKILADPSYVQGSGGDPWATAIPGSYGAGTAGKIVGDNVNATISSRSSHSATDPWNISFATEFDEGSMGDSLNNATYVQGSASGLTAEEVAESTWVKFTYGTNEQTFWAELDWVLAKIDTLAMRQGLEPGSWFAIRRWVDRDSMWVGHGADTFLVQELIHTAQGAGAPPDSGNTIGP